MKNVKVKDRCYFQFLTVTIIIVIIYVLLKDLLLNKEGIRNGNCEEGNKENGREKITIRT